MYLFLLIPTCLIWRVESYTITQGLSRTAKSGTQPACHQTRDHGRDVTAKAGKLLYCRRAEDEKLAVCRHENGLDPRIEPLVEHRELELVREVRHGTYAAYQDSRSDFLGEIHHELVPDVHENVLMGRQQLGEHLVSLLGSEHVLLAGVVGNDDMELLEKVAAAQDNIQMAVGRRIE